jgi:DNA-binding transcriptional ArsR family regulator
MARTPDSFDRLAALDKSVHEPARLAILTALSACRSAQFRFLQSLTGLTQGNLSIHLTKLAEKGFVEIEKRFDGRYPATNVRLTPAGRKAISEHWRQLDGLRAAADAIATDHTRE